MPTMASCCVIGHLYGPPEAIKDQSRPGASFRFWTSDKKRDGEKVFTSFRGAVWGPQAEWMLRDGKKGSLVAVTGTFRLDSYEKADGTKGHAIEIRASEARILDCEHDQHGAEAAQRPAPRPAPTPAAGGDTEPPF